MSPAFRLAIGVAACVVGCGRELPPQHPFLLEFPVLDCHTEPSPCTGFIGCYRLGIWKIHVTVGPKHCEDTTILCVTNGPGQTADLYYQPGQDYYEIYASYERDGSTVKLSAGPFSEDESQTPWKLAIPR